VVHGDEPVGLERPRVEFDDEPAVLEAGVVLVATLAGRLGIEALAGCPVRLRRDRPGAAKRGPQGDGAAVRDGARRGQHRGLRGAAGRQDAMLGGWMPAPSTLATFLRAFTFGRVRRLDALLGEALVRAADGRRTGRRGVGDRCGRLRR
jgi:hypothetical protein